MGEVVAIAGDLQGSSVSVVGFDTVRVVVPCPGGMQPLSAGFVQEHAQQSDCVRGRNFTLPGTGVSVHVKGVGHDQWLSWEGSVPKALGIAGVADANDVRTVCDTLQELIPGAEWDRMRLGRVDVTVDYHDPGGVYRRAAIGWEPLARMRPVQAVYGDPGGDQVETVMTRNKVRSVRVYGKWAEQVAEIMRRKGWRGSDPDCSAAEWARDLTRLELQCRGPWPLKYGLRDPYAEHFDAAAVCAILPLMGEIEDRARDREGA